MAKRVCEGCGKPLIPYRENQRFCQPACRDKFKSYKRWLRKQYERTYMIDGELLTYNEMVRRYPDALEDWNWRNAPQRRGN